MSPNWTVRRYREGDEVGINDLFCRVFEVDRSLDAWRWKFLDDSAGRHAIIQVAHDGDRIVGQYAALGARFHCGRREIIAAQPVDNMIDPEYRQGLGRSRMQRTMFREGLAAAREEGVVVAYGFPNRQAYRVGKKLLGYRDLGPIEVRLRSLTWARHVRRLVGDGRIAGAAGRVHAGLHRLWLRLRRPALHGAVIRRVSDFDDRVDRLWAEASPSWGVLAVRDRRFLSWRYGKRPGSPYTILLLERGDDLLGYTVLALREGPVRIGLVADIFSLPGAGIAERLVVASLEHLLDAGADLAECWSPTGGRYQAVLRQYFPRLNPEPIRAVYQVFDESLEEPLEEEILSDIAAWHLTMGDADGV